MALTKVTGQVINNTTDLVVGVTTVGGGVSAVDGFFSGIVTFSSDVSVAGTLTYEDVTNVDSVGLITARNGIVVGSGITLSKDGDGFYTGVVTATSFSGSGALLTGVASTENIRTNTNATFLQNINVSGTSTATNFIGGGANLTALNATQLTSGTIPDARFPATLPAISGANLTGIEAGMSTTSAQVSGITTVIDLSKDDIRLDCTGLVTIDTKGGSEGTSHSLRIVNSGISTVSFNSYFKFPSGSSPILPTTSGAISMISFTIHTQGRVGVATVLLAGSSVNFS